MPMLKKYSIQRDNNRINPHADSIILVKSIRLQPEELHQMAAESSSPRKWAREIPKSTYEGRGVPSAPEFVERIRLASRERAAAKARVGRILGSRGMRTTELGPDFSKQPRGRHRPSPHYMGRAFSRRHDYSCRVCKPSRTDHIPDCRLCAPLTAYAQGGHRLEPDGINHLPMTMEYVDDARQNRYRYVPQMQFEDAWRRMKMVRHERAAIVRERSNYW